MKIFFIALGIVLFLGLLVGPFVVPVPELDDTLPVTQLAGPEGRFISVNGVAIHYRQSGEGEPAFVLLHGFSASVFTWREVIKPLSEMGTVLAYDRPAFGFTERPLQWQQWNPYGSEEQVDIVLALLDGMNIDRAILVGNSAGGAVAARTAIRFPKRVKALVLVSPAIYTQGGAPGWIRPLLRTPQMRHLGPRLVRAVYDNVDELLNMAWHDPDRVTADVIEGYRRPLQAHNWDRALWSFASSSLRENDLAAGLEKLELPILVVTGDNDRVVPTSESVRLAKQTGAELVVINQCGHLPQEECPEPFVQTVRTFLDR